MTAMVRVRTRDGQTKNICLKIKNVQNGYLANSYLLNFKQWMPPMYIYEREQKPANQVATESKEESK